MQVHEWQAGLRCAAAGAANIVYLYQGAEGGVQFCEEAGAGETAPASSHDGELPCSTPRALSASGGAGWPRPAVTVSVPAASAGLFALLDSCGSTHWPSPATWPSSTAAKHAATGPFRLASLPAHRPGNPETSCSCGTQQLAVGLCMPCPAGAFGCGCPSPPRCMSASLLESHSPGVRSRGPQLLPLLPDPLGDHWRCVCVRGGLNPQGGEGQPQGNDNRV